MGTGKIVPQVFIGDGVNTSATVLSSIGKGDLFLVKKGGTLITTSAAAAALSKNDEVHVAMGIATGKALLSMPIKGTQVKSFLGNKYDAPVQEVSYIGYNGTSGSLPTAINSTYRMRLVFKGAQVLSTRSPWFGDVLATTGGTTTQAALALKLVDGFNTVADAAKYVKAERVSNGTKATMGTSTGTFTFTKGSKVVTTTGTIEDATAGTALTVGSSFVLGVTGNTASVYVITELDTTNDIAILDTPYVGETADFANTALKNITAANTVAATYGIKLTGLEIPDLLEDYDPYKITNFEVVFAEVGVDGTYDSAALITYATKASVGNGYFRQVRADELEGQTFRGWHSKTEYYHQKPERFTATSGGYDSVFIEYDVEGKGDFGRKDFQPLVAKIYIPTGTGQSDEDTSNTFASILNSYFATVCGFTAINLDA